MGNTSICLIAHNACGAMRGGVTGHIGGAEQQTALMARWLAARGHRVSLLTWDEGLPTDTIIDGVSMLGVCRADAGVPGLRFIYPRGIGLFAAMKKANADVYYHNSAEAVTGLAAAWCRRQGRQFIYSVASDVACERDLPTLRGIRDRALYRYGVRTANKVIVQTNRQATLLKESFGVEATPLPMPCRFTPVIGSAAARPFGPPRVAWVGRIDRMKRMEWVLDIAERMPEIIFDLVGADAHISSLADYAEQLRVRAESIPNVKWHGALPHEQVRDIYRKALCLCCTSSYEGFPNTFLESWSQARPIVSSFDPDGLIQKHEMGSFAREVAEFVEAIRELSISSESWHRQSLNSLDYYSRNHNQELAMPRFEKVILETIRKAEGVPMLGTSDLQVPL